VQKYIREKIECFSCIHLDSTADNIEQNKVVKKITKRAVSETTGRVYDRLYQQLSMKEGENDII
jgi:hypothetical protein